MRRLVAGSGRSGRLRRPWVRDGPRSRLRHLPDGWLPEGPDDELVRRAIATTAFTPRSRAGTMAGRRRTLVRCTPFAISNHDSPGETMGWSIYFHIAWPGAITPESRAHVGALVAEHDAGRSARCEPLTLHFAADDSSADGAVKIHYAEDAPGRLRPGSSGASPPSRLAIPGSTAKVHDDYYLLS